MIRAWLKRFRKGKCQHTEGFLLGESDNHMLWRCADCDATFYRAIVIPEINSLH